MTRLRDRRRPGSGGSDWPRSDRSGILIQWRRHEADALSGDRTLPVNLPKIAFPLLVVISLGLTGCGTQTGDRIASGAAIGAGTGAVFGGVGALPGAIVGGTVGAIAPPEKVNLGDPAWD